MKNTTTKDKPAYMTDLTYLRDVEAKYGILSALKGRALFDLRDTLAALPHLDLYYRSMRGERPDYNSLYIECLSKSKRYQDVVKVCSEIISINKYMPGVEKYYENAYVIVKGSKDGFDEQLKKDLVEKRKSQKTEISRSRINKPAPGFSLKDINGKTVKLSDLKGKIVIIDFWAIWCGPCRTSLPYFQQAYEKYKNNKNVAFFAINTWEKTAENEKEKTIKSFINSNNYSFPVLVDDSTKFVEKLGVESIPTKFAIDQDGIVQFSSVGFNGAEEMLTEIDLWIELLMRKE
jgi:thiol-disulfide isomerase/thioredoxin